MLSSLLWLCVSVSQRMSSEEGMSCAEFLYPLFQAFDFLHLHTKHNCWLQVFVHPYKRWSCKNFAC